MTEPTPDEREKAIEAIARAQHPRDFWNEDAEYPTQTREDYEAGQIVARNDAEPALDALIALGWGPTNALREKLRVAEAFGLAHMKMADDYLDQIGDLHTALAAAQAIIDAGKPVVSREALEKIIYMTPTPAGVLHGSLWPFPVSVTELADALLASGLFESRESVQAEAPKGES